MNSTVTWLIRDEALTLGEDEVHVFRAELGVSKCLEMDLSVFLDGDEVARANRFRSESARRRFVVSHGILRKILGYYLDQPPQSVQIHLGQHGKPIICGSEASTKIHFNMSHSGELALYAVTSKQNVGIDMERIRPGVATKELAESVFANEELRELETLAGQALDQAFFVRWTCKEAYVKARGEGLSIPLKRVEISLAASGHPALRVPGDKQWNLTSFLPDENFTAALVVEGRNALVRYFTWP